MSVESKLKPTKPLSNKLSAAPLSKAKQAKLIAQQQLEQQQLHQSNIILCNELLHELIDRSITQHMVHEKYLYEIQQGTQNALNYIVDVIDFNVTQRYDIGETNDELWRCEEVPKRCQIDNWGKNYVNQSIFIG